MVAHKHVKSISLFANEARLFELIAEHGPCNSSDLSALTGADLLLVMRTVHRLEERGLLVRTSVQGRKLFMIKPTLKSFKVLNRPGVMT